MAWSSEATATKTAEAGTMTMRTTMRTNTEERGATKVAGAAAATEATKTTPAIPTKATKAWLAIMTEAAVAGTLKLAAELVAAVAVAAVF